MLAVSSLVFAATDTAFFKVLISLRLAESRILPAAPVDTRHRTPLISFCTVQLRTLCAAHSLATLYLSKTSGPDTGQLPGFWDSMVFRHTPIPRKGSDKQQHLGSWAVCLAYFIAMNCLFAVYLPLCMVQLQVHKRFQGQLASRLTIVKQH